MSQDSLLHSLETLKLNKKDAGSDTITEFVKNPESLASGDGLQRLLELLKRPNVDLLSEMVINDPDQFLKKSHAAGDDNCQVLLNILLRNPNNTELIRHVLDVVKINLKSAIATPVPLENAKFYLNVYLRIQTSFQLFNSQHLYCILPYLNPYLGDIKETSPVILLIAVNFLKHDKGSACEVIADYLELIYTETLPLSPSQYFNFIKVIELFMPLIPEIVTTTYTKHSKPLIDYQIAKIKSPEDILKNKALVTETLCLFNNSCINDECRQFTHDNYFQILKIATRNDDYLIKLLSTLTIVKLWQFAKVEKELKIEHLASIFLEYIPKHRELDNVQLLEYCVEGLAYLSMKTSIKKSIRMNESVLDLLIALLKQDTPSTINYGILAIMNNLTKLPDSSDTQEKQTKNYLKNMATPNLSDNTKESKDEILLFNDSLLTNHKIVAAASKLKTTEDSGSNLIGALINIIYLISMNQKKQTKIELVKQGSLKLLLHYLIKHSIVDKKTGITTPKGDTEIRLLAIRALARISYAINPAVAFNEYDVSSTVPFLVELLGPRISNYTGIQGKREDSYLFDQVTNIDKFESLLALTNISSVDKRDLKRFIIAKVFDDYLDNFILDSDHPQIQKASWELTSNLIGEPTMLVKFFNIDNTPETKQNLKRLQLLISLLDTEDEDLQVVLTGLLANATSEFDMISQVLFKNEAVREKLVAKLSSIMKHQLDNNEILLRVSYIVTGLVYCALNMNQLAKLKNANFIRSIEHALKTTRNKEVVEILQDSFRNLS